MIDSKQPLFISALQHLAFCPRQFALIHVEQVWAENRFTVEGQLLHQRVDSGKSESRSGVRSERGVLIKSDSLEISGRMDLLEIEQGETPNYIPVEYKRGKPKVQDWDRIQLCAQALCIEEMRGVVIEQGAIWYWEVRRREQVLFDTELRQTTIAAIAQAHGILSSGKTPSPTSNKARCRACSLVDLCEPTLFREDCSSQYISELFKQ